MKMKDLLIVVADKSMEQAMKGLLGRPLALGIRQIEVEIFRYSEKDSGCFSRGVPFMSDYSDQYRYGLLLFDHKGCGQEATPPQELANDLDAEFAKSGWEDRAKTIIISPELEAWVWSDSPHVSKIAGWRNNENLRSWLIQQEYLQEGEAKPKRPKKAFVEALCKSNKIRSASLYFQLAQHVSLQRCTDPSFLELKRILKKWFPPEN